MLKINYPTIPKDKLALENKFYNSLNSFDETAINTHLSNIPFKRGNLTLDSLVKLSFDELINLEPDILKYSKTKDRIVLKGKKNVVVNDFKELFNYNNNQPSIATFFMQQECFKLNICHYCGIDYVNAFSDVEDYQDGLDFLNRANLNDLQFIIDIGKGRAKVITEKRKKTLFTYVDEIGYSQRARDQIKDFDFKNSHNHFTLDHILPQKTHKFYSLCLYNLVPSCYSCNSKFKGSINFKINNKLKNISPTSSSYSLSKDFRFRIFYPNIKFNNIKNVSEFVLDRKILRNKAHLDSYFEMFKIGGRYTYQKSQILPLIQNKVNYPPSKVRELSRQTGFSIKEVNKMIFGKELFDNDLSNQPMIKLKRDIAKKLRIKGVI
jgi:hypothetical protein